MAERRRGRARARIKDGVQRLGATWTPATANWMSLPPRCQKMVDICHMPVTWPCSVDDLMRIFIFPVEHSLLEESTQGDLEFVSVVDFVSKNPRLSGTWHVVLLQNLWWQGVGRQSLWEPRHGVDFMEGFLLDKMLKRGVH